MTNRHIADITPLRESRPYRALFSATMIANIGQGMTSVAVGIQVYRATGSSFAVGLIGFFQFLPLLMFGLLGGSLSDRRDRRTMNLFAATGLMSCSLMLAIATEFGWANLVLLYAIVGLQTAFFGVGAPARQATVPRLIPSAQLPAANALSMFAWTFGATVGPMLGGFVIGATDNLAVVYFADFTIFLFALALLRRLPSIPPTGELQGGHLSSIREGFAYIRTRRAIQMNLYIDIVAMVFGLPRALFPAIATGWYAGDAAAAAMAVGLLSAAVTAGAAVSSVFSGRLTGISRHGAAVVVSVFAWGLSITAFGVAPNLWVSLGCLALAGAADNVSAIFRNTIMQAAVPDSFRGRLQGVYTVVVGGGPRLGDLESGSVAAWRGETFSVVSGGLLCIVGALALTWYYRDYWSYDAREDSLA